MSSSALKNGHSNSNQNNSNNSHSNNISSSNLPKRKKRVATKNPRRQPTAASVASSQLDRPYIAAFLLLLSIYTFVTFCTYEKLSRAEHDHHASSLSRLEPQLEHDNVDPHSLEYLRYHSFPLHVTQDDSEWIDHPGLNLVADPSKIPPQLPRRLLVPQFWADAYHEPYNQTSSVRQALGDNGARLMTPDEAASIGSYTTAVPPNTTTSSSDNRHKDDNLLLETIYLSVASYRDPECTLTVDDIYATAKYPERIRVSVIDQSVTGTDVPCLIYEPPRFSCDQEPEQSICRYRHLMDYYHIDAHLAVGPVFARHLAHRSYRGEYFAMQVDSHVRFTQDWDVDLVQQWKSAHNEYAVLTTYLSDINGHLDRKAHKSTNVNRPIMCASDYEGQGDLKHLRHGQQPEGPPGIHGQPTLQPFWAAGFSFARGHFVVQVPYDQYLPMVFQGEEISIGLRGFTYGYDYYAPERGVCYHMYAAKDTTGKRKKIHLFWENTNIYKGTGMIAMKRLNSIIRMGPHGDTYPADEWPQEDQEKYGLGSVRTSQKFFDTFGIHTQNQTVEGHLCSFVGKPMMEKFLPHLRPDGMGLDYDAIEFQFLDPKPPIPRKYAHPNIQNPKAVPKLPRHAPMKLGQPHTVILQKRSTKTPKIFQKEDK